MRTNRDFYIRLPEELAAEFRQTIQERSITASQLMIERLTQWNKMKQSSDVAAEEASESALLPPPSPEAGLLAEADRNALEEAIQTLHEMKHTFIQSQAQLQQRIHELETRLDGRTHELVEQIGKVGLLKLHLDKIEGIAHAVRTYCEQIMIDVVRTPEDLQLREDIINQVQAKLEQLFYPEEMN